MINFIEEDVKFAKKIIGEAKSSPNKLFFSTNDKIQAIIRNFNVNDKKVLTILGSGDQAFHFYGNGAKRVDVVEKNKIAIYYYFIRRWTIEYLRDYYPPRSLFSPFLIDLLSKVKPKTHDEVVAYNFWKMYIDETKDDKKSGGKLFTWRDPLLNFEQFDISDMADRLRGDQFNIFHNDIRDDFGEDKTYDIIYTSNVNDWIHVTNDTGRDEYRTLLSFRRYRDNLDRLLGDNGVIITAVYCDTEAEEVERRIFEENFDYHVLPKIYDQRLHDNVNCGYCYTKKGQVCDFIK